jgi:hypothetical protein
MPRLRWRGDAVRYVYFVSYSYATETVSGYGNVTVVRDRITTTVEDIRAIQQVIEIETPTAGVIILYFTLLRTEEVVS